MLVLLVFGVFSYIFCGWWWKFMLVLLGEYFKIFDCVYVIFVFYVVNLVVFCVGEIFCCGVLVKYDGIFFFKLLGMVVMEWLIDMLCVLLIIGVIFIMQVRVFDIFFKEIGMDIMVLVQVFILGYFYIIIVCVLVVLVLVFFLIRNVMVFVKVKGIFYNVWVGVLFLCYVKWMFLFIFYIVGIWICYFL